MSHIRSQLTQYLYCVAVWDPATSGVAVSITTPNWLSFFYLDTGHEGIAP
jgi:hypothetical protein